MLTPTCSLVITSSSTGDSSSREPVLLLLGNERLGRQSSNSLISGTVVLDHYPHPLYRPHLSLASSMSLVAEFHLNQWELGEETNSRHCSLPETSVC